MSMIKALGSFECTTPLGKAGMGEVYKAKDQKLGRNVAIKVLPEEFAKGEVDLETEYIIMPQAIQKPAPIIPTTLGAAPVQLIQPNTEATPTTYEPDFGPSIAFFKLLFREPI